MSCFQFFIREVFVEYIIEYINAEIGLGMFSFLCSICTYLEVKMHDLVIVKVDKH